MFIGKVGTKKVKHVHNKIMQVKSKMLLKRGNTITRVGNSALGKGKVNLERFMDKLKHASQHLEEGALERLHRLIDLDEDGKVTLAEFTTATISMARDISDF